MIQILPQSLQDRVQEHLDRLTTYSEVHDKVVGLVQASSKYSGGDAMDCSQLEEQSGEPGGSPWEEQEDEINAPSRFQCARCQGYGHYARDCPTPPTKGAGKGKSDYKGKGGSKGGPYGKEAVVCSHCRRPGRTQDKCFDLHPELKRKNKEKRVAAIDGEEVMERKTSWASSS